MAIITAQPVPTTQVVTPSSAYQISLTEDWKVQTDEPTVGDPSDYGNPLFFIGDPLFPGIGTAHPRSSVLLFKTFQSATQHSHTLWTFRGMEYATDQLPLGVGLEDDFEEDRYDDLNPLAADRSWNFQTVEKALDKARVSDPTGANKFDRPVDEVAFPFSTDPEPVATRNVGEPILGLTRTRYLPVCTYIRNEINPPTNLLTDDLVGSVNSDAITVHGLSVPAGTCCLQDLTISSAKRSLISTGAAVAYHTMTYVLVIDKEGWDEDVLHAGYYAVEPGPVAPNTPAFHRIKVPGGLDGTGARLKPVPASTPQLLDVLGEWLPTDPSLPGTTNWRDDVHYRVFRTKGRIPFAQFNFS